MALARICAHKPCGKPIPRSADPRTRYHSDACRHAASRARKAAERNGPLAVVRPLPGGPAEDDAGPSRYEDVRALWDAMIRQLADDGLMTIGAAGIPVSHPMLKHFTALHSAMRDLEAGTDSGTEETPLEQMRRLARQALADYQEEFGT